MYQQNTNTSKQEENRDFQGLDSTTGEENYAAPMLKGSVSFDDTKGTDDHISDSQNETNVSDKQEDNTATNDNELFNKVMKHLYVAEGGFVDDPDDRGGRTNKGVTQRAFDAYNKKNGLPLKDVKDITTEEATEFYRKEYWIKSGANEIKDKNLAYMHYDAAINHGVGTAKKLLKQSGGDFGKYYQSRKDIYTNLAKKPNQQKYYKGWINRIDNIDRMRRENVLED